MVIRRVWDSEIEGSNPSALTKSRSVVKWYHGRLLPDYYRFESYRSGHILVSSNGRTLGFDPRNTGSNPFVSTILEIVMLKFRYARQTRLAYGGHT